MHVTLRQLQVFEAVARHGSFTRAAEALHLTQPSVSIQVRQLADSVGLPLVEQVGRRIRLTETGQELYGTCREMTDAWSRFEMLVDDLKGLKRGRLRVSVVTTAKYFLPRVLGAFSGRYPGVDVELEILNRDGVLARLKDNLDDLCIMGMPPQAEDLEALPLVENPIVVVAPLDCPIRDDPPVRLDALRDQRFILREKGSGTRMAVDDFLASHKARLNVRMTMGSNEAIKHAVAGGMGLTILSKHALMPDPSQFGLRILRVREFPLRRTWYVVHRRDRRLSVVARTFLEYLLSHAPELRLPEDAAGPRVRQARNRPHR